MRRVIRNCALLLCVIASPTLADPFAMTDKACAQDDSFVTEAILDYVRELYPNQSVDIQRYYEKDCRSEKSIALQKQQKQEERLNHKVTGEIEFAANWDTGDVKRRDFLTGLELKHKIGDFTNRLEASSLNEKNNDVTTAEEYRALIQSDYRLNDQWFIYGEIDYVDDRFSGFDYRLSELVGPGYIVYDNDEMYWDMRLGLGARQDKFLDGDVDNTPLAKWETDFDWAFRKGWKFRQDASIALSNQNTIFQSETALQSKITDALALKAAYNIEHITDAPINTEPTDTRTTLGAVYGF